jgi:hypothetical protein
MEKDQEKRTEEDGARESPENVFAEKTPLMASMVERVPV